MIAKGKDPCGWSGGNKCGGCAGVCGNPAAVVVVEDWEARSDGLPCAGLPEPKDVDPDDVVNLDEDWKLQLPCLDIATDANGLSYCTDDRTELINGSASPGVWTVFMSEDNSPGDYSGPYLGDFRLMPREYGPSRMCSGGMYVADDADGDQMVVLYVPIAGTTTPGSKNPRVELRQMQSGTSSNAGFNLSNPGTNKLTTTQRVVHVPANYKSTSVVQVFNGGYSAAPPAGFSGGGPFIEIITQKCQYSWQKVADSGTRCPAGAIGIGVWKDGKFGGKGGFIFEEYTLGTKFDLEIVIPGDGSVTIKYKHTGDADWLTTYTFDCDDGAPDGGNPCLAGQSGDAAYPTANGVYFKVGSYVQKAPDEAADDYALSYMYSAEVSGLGTSQASSVRLTEAQDDTIRAGTRGTS